MHSGSSAHARNKTSSRVGAASGRGFAPPGQARHGEHLLQALVAVDLAPDVADDPAQAGSQELDLPVHALELLGVGMAPGHHRRLPGNTRIGLAQLHVVLLRQLAELVDRRLQPPGVGREGDVLGLHRGVDGDARQITRLQGAGVVGNAQALGQQNVQPVADTPPPIAHAGALVRELMLEELLAGEVLEIGIMHPAVPDLLVGQGVGVFQQKHADHEAHRLRRAPRLGKIIR